MLRALLISLLSLSISPAVRAQDSCPPFSKVEGNVMDQTGAEIPSATVRLAGSPPAVTNGNGHYTLACVPNGETTLEISASGFATQRVRVMKAPNRAAHVNVRLAVATINEEVQVTANDASSTGGGASTRVLGTEQIQQLSDDPNDFIQQLQILASSEGAAPESTLFVVDGFQNASAMPPKNSIASIRINPDPYSAEYEGPTFLGGRVELTTKAGADKYHGALFFTDSDSAFNATDPFSVTATPAGKRRYGFEFSGPIRANRSGFSLALEKRDIDEFNVVNALTLGTNGSAVPLRETVPAPQSLWIASGRVDMQVSPKDYAAMSFAANVNSLGNQEVGGLVLPEAGYQSQEDEYDLRLINTFTAGANSVDQFRAGYTWKRTTYTPSSNAPSLTVAGYFTGGGATSQNLDDRERDLELDNDWLTTRGKHSWTIGAQSLGFFVHTSDPDTFNGAYVFGGGSAPVLDSNNQPTGQTTTITALEQYRRAINGLSGGSPTTYQVNSGVALVPFTEWRLALYAQDIIKLNSHLSLSAGLRYAFQTSPSSFLNFGPRLALTWSPDKKGAWVIHLREGLFDAPAPLSYTTDVYRLSGQRQQSVMVYSPDYQVPLTPTAGSIQVSTTNRFATHIFQFPAAAFQAGVEHDFRYHWHVAATWTFAEDWGIFRTRNINAPNAASEVGTAPDPTEALKAPRPLAPNENIFEYQNSGHLRGSVVNFSVAKRPNKFFDLNLSYSLVKFLSDAPLQIAPPQSSYTNRGEASRPDWQTSGGSAEGMLHLPYRIELSTQLAVRTGRPYNITTGTDANGDGTFNDRPSYTATPGTGVYSTPYGLLTANTVNGDVPRNLGTMPSTWRLFANISRTFQIERKDAKGHQSITFNARASNLLNHTNTTAVGTVLSPNLGQSVAAEAARRIELGVRYSF